jgi:fumarate hydratase class II
MPNQRQLWGAETTKAVENFPISGETVPVGVIHWLARIKGAAAAVNGELGLLSKRSAARIEKAAAAIAAGSYDDQFPIDVFQTGSGTSTNTNANEVISRLAGEGVHANDHVNMGQSSNDVFPSAVHLAALDVAQNELLPALKQLERSFARKASSFKNVVKAGRTHLMDAVPVTLGQEFAGYAAQMALASERVQSALVHVGQIPLGGTATGTGLNTHPRFAEKVRARLKRESNLKQIAAPLDPFEAQGNRDALVELSGALKVLAVSLTKIAGDLALMGSGPRAGIGEILLPELQKGSSIMPGKVNPVICEVVLQVAADRAQPHAVAEPAVLDGARVRREVRRRHSGQQGRDGHLRGRHAGRGNRPERSDRLRQGHGDREEGDRLRAPAAGGRARGGGRREAVRRDDRPAPDRSRKQGPVGAQAHSAGRAPNSRATTPTAGLGLPP